MLSHANTYACTLVNKCINKPYLFVYVANIALLVTKAVYSMRNANHNTLKMYCIPCIVLFYEHDALSVLPEWGMFRIRCRPNGLLVNTLLYYICVYSYTCN